MKKLFTEVKDENGHIIAIKTSLHGKRLLDYNRLNKGVGFNADERERFGLTGFLPDSIETLDCQIMRAYLQYQSRPTNMAKNIFLNRLKMNNETLFYALTMRHIDEMLPIVYTPTIAEAVEKFSSEYSTYQGIYFSYQHRDNLENILLNSISRTVDLVIVTDGEGVLGIGDWGVGGMDILIGKSMVYTICAGINPRRVLCIQFDVGTNNEKLLKDPMYLGWRHKRVTGKDYDNFIDQAITAISNVFPNVLLHWEDFGRENARKNLQRYRDKLCTFNDDMQGTGATATATIMSGLNAIKANLHEQRIVLLGAGTAGCGIADSLCRMLVRDGLSEQEAKRSFWLVDRPGLLVEGMPLQPFQETYARSKDDIKDWQLTDANNISLLDVVKNVKPTILIGCSTVHGAFSEEIIKTMAAHVEQPLIFPLSNPNQNSEADPADLIKWTNGKAFIAAGSPYDPVTYRGQEIRIAQCNNAFIYPGVALGVIVSGATRITDNMFAAGSQALSECSPAIKDPTAPLLPSFGDAHRVCKCIAVATAKQAIEDGVATIDNNVNLAEKINAIFWNPVYLPYEKA